MINIVVNLEWNVFYYDSNAKEIKVLQKKLRFQMYLITVDIKKK